MLRLALVVALLLAGLAVGVAALWVWSDTEGSLATSASLAQRWLPVASGGAQRLVVEQVSGTLRGGGRIAALRWQQGTQQLELQNLRVAWDWQALRSGRLRVPQLAADLLRYTDTDTSSAVPLQQLTLPLPVDAVFDIATLALPGLPDGALQMLQGRYVYDGSSHRWDVTRLHIAQGVYRTHGSVQAAAPMALQLQWTGEVPMEIPGGQGSVMLQASGQAQGALAGQGAALDLEARLQGTQALQATLRARIRPWQAQPLEQLQAQYHGVNLAALWPQAPQTRLTGEASIAPQGGSWHARASARNTLAGPWNQQRLPLDSLEAALLYQGGQWALQRLDARIAGGALQARGAWSRASQVWTVDARVQGIPSQQIDTRLAADRIDGRLELRHIHTAGISGLGEPSGLDFVLALTGQPMGAAARARRDADTAFQPVQMPHLQQLQAQGRWAGPLLQLDVLDLQTASASLQGPLRLRTDLWEASGHLRAVLPGATVALEGALGPHAGDGALRLQAKDTQAMLRWLAQLPLQAALSQPYMPLHGSLALEAQWQGGWDGLALSLQAKAANAVQTLQLQAQWQGGLKAGAADGADGAPQRWAGAVQTLQLSLQDLQSSAAWTAKLAQPVALQGAWDARGAQVALAPGVLEFGASVPGRAQLQWQAADWSRTAAGQTRWQSQGRLDGVPLGWLELLGQTALVNLGLQGDVVVGGSWEASQQDRLTLRVALQRTAGDLQILSQDHSSTLLGAGLRNAQMQLQVDDDVATLALGWNSQSAGTASAQVQTRLQRKPWHWPADAPLQGTVSAQLPRVGAWSLLAPPGWRMQGTLDMALTLGGTRTAPQWSGTVQARELAIRSVVDGIDFSQGVLRLVLQGQRMDIAELTLRGASSSASPTAGGTLKATGQLQWLEPEGQARPVPMANRIRMHMDAQADQLAVSARADQQLVVSGQVAATFADARLQVRGTLVADRARFVLSSNSTPRLGADVVVRPTSKSRSAADTLAHPPARASSGITRENAVQIDAALTLDPGSDFRLSGQGIDTRLVGQLALRAVGNGIASPRLRGELRTVGGTYKAYGQTLDVDTGVLRFSGAYDNPALDILALRPNVPQPVGVQISGTVERPVVRLYSDPEMSDAEKLSWLVLGRSASTSGTEYALLQSAALAFVAGRGEGLASGLIKAFGLDEVSLGETSVANADGANTVATTVKVGKRLSRDFYVAYERSIATTLGTFYVFYDLSRRFTLRAQSGSENALDLIFTTRFD